MEFRFQTLRGLGQWFLQLLLNIWEILGADSGEMDLLLFCNHDPSRNFFLNLIESGLVLTLWHTMNSLCWEQRPESGLKWHHHLSFLHCSGQQLKLKMTSEIHFYMLLKNSPLIHSHSAISISQQKARPLSACKCWQFFTELRNRSENKLLLIGELVPCIVTIFIYLIDSWIKFFLFLLKIKIQKLFPVYQMILVVVTNWLEISTVLYRNYWRLIKYIKYQNTREPEPEPNFI